MSAPAVTSRATPAPLDSGRALPPLTPIAEREPFPSTALALLSRPTRDSLRLPPASHRVTIVNVWASWCEPCRAELPRLDALARSLARDSIDVVTVNDDLDRRAAQRFSRENHLTLPVGMAAGHAAEWFHLRGLPSTLVIDRSGRTALVVHGYAGVTQIAQLRDAVLRLANER